jgi:sigma-E factor negative regulatory protein RseA
MVILVDLTPTVMEKRMDTHKKDRAHISALCDGELPCTDAELAMAALRTGDGQQAWEAYFQIGDALRAAATPALSQGFAARLAARLDAEPLPVPAAPADAPGTAAPEILAAPAKKGTIPSS